MKTRLCAVSYLNTTPLVWGLLHGAQQNAFDLRFELPAVCADLLRTGEVDIGLVPAIELERQRLTAVGRLGIASRGAVRSILLVSKADPRTWKSVALDTSSRTSVVLTRILLEKRFGVAPQILSSVPDIHRMLDIADAGLVIGDPALRMAEGSDASWQVRDLGQEWSAWLGLPMVYAVWAAREGVDGDAAAVVLKQSWEFGRSCIPEIARVEGPSRGIAPSVAETYLADNIHFELGENEEAGLMRFRSLARELHLV